MNIIRHRLRNDMFYDDIEITLVLVYLMEFIYVFRYFFNPDQTVEKKLVIIISFLVIQTQNILNKNPVIQLYKKCLKKRLLILLNFIVFQYLLVLLTHILQILGQVFSDIYVVLLAGIVTWVFQVLARKDNRTALELISKNIE